MPGIAIILMYAVCIGSLSVGLADAVRIMKTSNSCRASIVAGTLMPPILAIFGVVVVLFGLPEAAWHGGAGMAWGTYAIFVVLLAAVSGAVVSTAIAITMKTSEVDETYLDNVEQEQGRTRE